MKKNLLKEKISNGIATYGVISPTTDPIICEYIGLNSYDYYMIDGEHGPITSAVVPNLVRACENVGCTPLARIRSVDTKLILQYMDVGVMGVMMPTIDDVDDVRRLVDAIKYPPMGQRGLGPVRAADYMQGPHTQEQYVQFANQETMVLPQVESLACVDNLEKLCAIEGVDGFIVGPRDLAMSMGYYDGPNHPEVKEMLDRIFKTILDNGKFFGTVAGTAEKAQELIDKGAMMILNSVQGLIKTSSKAFLKNKHS